LRCATERGLIAGKTLGFGPETAQCVSELHEKTLSPTKNTTKGKRERRKMKWVGRREHNCADEKKKKGHQRGASGTKTRRRGFAHTKTDTALQKKCRRSKASTEQKGGWNRGPGRGGDTYQKKVAEKKPVTPKEKERKTAGLVDGSKRNG